MARQTLIAANESPMGGHMCLYQRHPHQETDAHFFSLAWFSQPCGPGASLSFSWDLSYGFAWALTGPLMPGLVFEPGPIRPVDPQVPARQAIAFRRSGADFILENEDRELPPGHLGFRSDGSIPAGQASVALTISGRPALVRQAALNSAFSFQPDLFQYWLAFGPYEPGRVLDFSEMILTTEIKFGPRQTSARAAFQRDCSWRVGP